METSNNSHYNYTRKIKLNIEKKYYGNYFPTVKLLKSSVLVSISGALRVYIASLLLLTQASVLNCMAGGLIVYAVYTLDRALESTEDSINRSELNGANKKIALLFSLGTFLLGFYILINSGLITVALIPLITGYLYSKGINLGKLNLKLKGGLGIKNLVVGLTWGTFIVGIAGNGIGNCLPALLVFLYYASKLFINSTIYDFKDVRGDLMAGIKTLPVSFGEKNTRRLLLALHIMSHLLIASAIIMQVLAFEPLIILYSFFIGLVYIKRLTCDRENETTKGKIERLFLVDGESASILYLRAAIGSVA